MSGTCPGAVPDTAGTQGRGREPQMADADRAPDPRRAQSAREFIAALQSLKDWSRLTYRELAARADAVGDILPRSTIANMLGRTTLPREELVAAFVRACGVGPAELTVWLAVRKDLATRAAEPGAGLLGEAAADATPVEPLEPFVQGEPASPTAPSSSRTPEAAARRSRTPMLSGALALTVAVAATAAVLVWRAHDDGRGEGDGPDRKGGSAAVSSDGPAPAPGKYRIRAVHSSLCLSERPQDKTAWVYQVPCADVFPSFSLKRLDDGLWRIATLHPSTARAAPESWARARPRAPGWATTTARAGERARSSGWRPSTGPPRDSG
ncbi:hypothetical protein SANT12839_064770 [Streptomyces antimycoticus]|uniref:Uncharacterized protein n=2 Tax=Streptomyces antimycoticus TaxID=68175 RepID=A0A4D4K9C9_9ACTN|nr:hypothetical protein SANT12839_064770 [Streptomyces antimycoticus]